MFCSLKRAKCTFFFKKIEEKFGNSEKSSTFALAFRGTLLSNRKNCGNSSVGRAQPCQGWGREFESRFPLSGRSNGGMVDTKDLKSFGQKCPCEFESRFEHTIVILLSRHVTSVTRRLFVYRAKWVGEKCAPCVQFTRRSVVESGAEERCASCVQFTPDFCQLVQ